MKAHQILFIRKVTLDEVAKKSDPDRKKRKKKEVKKKDGKDAKKKGKVTKEKKTKKVCTCLLCFFFQFLGVKRPLQVSKSVH